MIEKQFLNTVKHHKLCTKDDKILVAVSGGKDSMALLHLFYEADYKIQVAHYNFKLRGNESDLDQKLVEMYCKERNIQFHAKSTDTKAYAQEHKISTQMAARELRYNWFDQLVIKNNLDYVATAHHADDNLETILLNITKGTGPKGLRGIPIKTNNIIRPLLEINTDKLKEYLVKKQIEWREDESNKENIYARNKIRNKVIPILKTINPGIVETSKSNIRRFNELNIIFEKEFADFTAQFLHFENRTAIPHQLISDTQGSFLLLEEFLKDYGFTYSDVADLVKISHPGKEIISRKYKLTCDREHWTLQKNEVNPSLELIINQVGVYEFEGQKFSIQLDNKFPENLKQSNLAILNAEKIRCPLKIRRWQKGDKFTPFGLKGSKLVSDYLKDIKIESSQKEEQLVVEDQHEILWLVNHRINDHFKVDNSKRLFLSIKFEKL